MKLFDLPEELISYIFTFIRRPQKLKKQIINDFLNNMNTKQKEDFWLGLNYNINAIDLLNNNKHKIDWLRIVTNTNAQDIIEENSFHVRSTLCCEYMARNTGLINFIEKNLDSMDWYYLCKNENAIKIINKNKDKIHFNALATNKNAIEILENNISKLNIDILIFNNNIFNSTKLTELIYNNFDNIRPRYFIYNKNTNKSKKIMDKLKNLLHEDDYLLIENPKLYFNSLKSIENIDLTFLFSYDQFIRNENVIRLILDLFHFEEQNEIKSVDLFHFVPQNENKKYLWQEILMNPYTIENSKLYKLLLNNKEHIDYYFLGKNSNIFENAI